MLFAVAVPTAVVETVLLWATGSDAALPLGPQVSAPPPFGVFHDLRWLLVYHRSWVQLAIVGVVAVAFRGGFAALMMHAAWPESVPRPPFRELLRRGVLYAAVMIVVLAPWAAMLIVVAVLPVSWLFLVGVPATLFFAVLLHHGVAPGRRWLAWPPLRSVGWVLFTFGVLTLASVVITTTPFPVALLAAAATGCYNAWAWNGLVNAVAPMSPEHRWRSTVPVAGVLVFALIVAGAYLGFEVRSASSEAEEDLARGDGEGRPVLVVAGYDSSWDARDGHVLDGRFDVLRFSYRGLDADDEPVAYDGDDTRRSLDVLVARMASQVAELAQRTRGRVAILAESEGALVAKVYLLTHPDAPVDDLILFSPLIQPGRVYYPPPGESGWGVGTGWELRGLGRFVTTLTGFQTAADAPLTRSILEIGPLLWPAMGCPVDGVDQRVFFPLADAVVAPYPATEGVPVNVVPAFHGGLLSDGRIRSSIALALEGKSVPDPGVLRVANLVVRGAASAWQVPTLGASLNPRWHGIVPGDVDDISCTESMAGLRRALVEDR